MSVTAELAKLSKDPQITSRQAYYDSLPKSGSTRDKVLQAIITASKMKKYRGASDDELAEILAMSPNTVRPRRVELVEGGWVEDSGKKRLNRWNGLCIVWKYTGKKLK